MKVRDYEPVGLYLSDYADWPPNFSSCIKTCGDLHQDIFDLLNGKVLFPFMLFLLYSNFMNLRHDGRLLFLSSWLSADIF